MRGAVAVAAALACLAAAVLIAGPGSGPGGDTRAREGELEAGDALGEEVEEKAASDEGREEALEEARRSGTLGVIEPVRGNPAPGWVGARLWHKRSDDWEPAVAGHPGSSRVYMLTTRYGGRKACRECPEPVIRIRKSRDAGAHWGPAGYLCRCRGSRHQYDPELEMSADGTLYAAWLDGFNPGVAFARSDDGGRTWTKPVHVDRSLRWSDKPIIAVSDDGDDVYIAFNAPTAGDAWAAVSHDRGETFAPPVPIARTRRYHFAGGAAVLADGTVAFGQTAYRQRANGPVRVLASTSVDGGATWRNVALGLMQKQPDCTSTGCPADFYGPQAAMAGDAAGDLLIVYNGARRPERPQRMYARTSSDGGLTWGARRRLSPKGANAAFPAAVGGAAGDFRLWFMDDRRGADDRWNVWYRDTQDGGAHWSRAVRISDARQGTKYLRPRGFLEPYGDYGEIAIIAGGATFAAWGEGISYFGPGGTWFNRTR